jgi:flagellar hook-length control protein FliK
VESEMTQLFTNISSLADFLVAQKNIRKPQTGDFSPVSGFEDFLSGQMTIGNLPENDQAASNFGINAGSADIDGLNKSAVPVWDIFSTIKFPTQRLTVINEQATEQAAKQAVSIPLESIMPVQINLGQLKQMASRQSIPLSLTISPEELASIIDVNEFQETLKSFSEEIPELRVTQQRELQTGQISSEFPQMFQLQDNKVKVLKAADIKTGETQTQQGRFEDSIRLSFDASELIDIEDERIAANICHNNEISHDIQVKVADLLNLIKKAPEKAIVQIKSLPTVDNQNQASIQSDISHNAAKFEKVYLVNLNSVISKDNIESVDALQKTILVKTAAVQTETEPVLPNSAPPAIYLANEPVAKLTEVSIPAEEPIGRGRQIGRNSEDPKNAKIESVGQRSAGLKSANRDIQPIQTSKSAEDSLSNIFGKEHDFKLIGNQIASEKKSLIGSESPELLVGQQRILNQIQSQLKTVNGNTQITIQLKPESLGKVKVEFKTEGDRLNATFRVDSPDVKRVLDAELPNLKNDWKIDNFRVETNVRGGNDNLANSGDFNHARLAEGRSSAISSRTNQSENERSNRDQNQNRTKSTARMGRIDFFA